MSTAAFSLFWTACKSSDSVSRADKSE